MPSLPIGKEDGRWDRISRCVAPAIVGGGRFYSFRASKFLGKLDRLAEKIGGASDAKLVWEAQNVTCSESMYSFWNNVALTLRCARLILQSFMIVMELR